MNGRGAAQMTAVCTVVLVAGIGMIDGDDMDCSEGAVHCHHGHSTLDWNGDGDNSCAAARSVGGHRVSIWNQRTSGLRIDDEQNVKKIWYAHYDMNCPRNNIHAESGHKSVYFFST